MLVAGTLATGATMVAAAVVAWRQRLAVQGSVLGATAFRLPRWPMAMRQTWQPMDPGPKQAFSSPRGSGVVRAMNSLIGACFGGRTETAEVRVRDVSASGRAVAAVIIGSAIRGDLTRRVRCKNCFVDEPVTQSGNAILACGISEITKGALWCKINGRESLFCLAFYIAIRKSEGSLCE